MSDKSPNDFPCLLIVTDFLSAKIDYCNDYTLALLAYDEQEMIGKYFSEIVSKATLILFESYIRPSVLESSESIEVQITLRTKAAERIPSVSNVRLHEGKLYWSIFTAVQRDKLYQELIETRDSLEKKAEALTQLTRIDPLSSLLNRRAATQDISVLIHRVKRSFTPMAFLLIDVDFFKKINDTYGHDKGDEVLISLSKALKSSCRETDILARWGGEEFLMVLYNSSVRGTAKFCESLHDKVAKLCFDDVSLTLSIGVSQLSQALLVEKNISDLLIKQADTALFEAKETGRNRTVFFKPSSTK
mgnify:CR=1 FL=1